MVHFQRNCQKILEPLDRIGWLSECSQPLQSWFASNGRWMHVAAGAFLFREFDDTDGMYGVGAGAVDVEFAPDGLESLAVLRVPPGGWLGQGCLVEDMPRQFSLVAAVDSNIYFVARSDLRQLLAENPAFWPEFYKLSLRHVLGTMTFLCEAHSLTPEARLSRQLLRLSVNSSEIHIRQDDLVALLGMSRSNVRRALGSLARAGVIETGYSKVVILDKQQLEATTRQTR